uniref:Uncharacterized protein n=1 Tax=Bicosoecida sp. CB-2014 TaxID=1486930 RepID=A0A7S1G547_9STRA|mmetsp:Transcript_14386/g.50019  ORF Transcript_14386/g.50019 Transcript_14386/m.50019 type:complete len:396 (+) Transcript_14386:52-1239(+)
MSVSLVLRRAGAGAACGARAATRGAPRTLVVARAAPQRRVAALGGQRAFAGEAGEGGAAPARPPASKPVGAGSEAAAAAAGGAGGGVEAGAAAASETSAAAAKARAALKGGIKAPVVVKKKRRKWPWAVFGGLVVVGGGALGYTLQQSNHEHPMWEGATPEFLDAVLCAPGLKDELDNFTGERRKRRFVLVSFVPTVPQGMEVMSVGMQVAVQEHNVDLWAKSSKDVRLLTAEIEAHDPDSEVVVCVSDAGAFNAGFFMRSQRRPYPPRKGTSMLNYKREAPADHPLATILDKPGYLEAIARSRIDEDGQRRFVRLDFVPVVLPAGGHGVAPRLSLWPAETAVTGLEEADREFGDDVSAALANYKMGEEAVVVINDNGLAHNKGPLTLVKVVPRK